MNINIISHSYHRNGVGGEGFHSVTFTTSGDRDSAGKTFTAVVTSKEAFVLRQTETGIDHEDHYRGTDYFHAPLIEAIAKKQGHRPFE